MGCGTRRLVPSMNSSPWFGFLLKGEATAAIGGLGRVQKDKMRRASLLAGHTILCSWKTIETNCSPSLRPAFGS
jgi:hypothetical protein